VERVAFAAVRRRPWSSCKDEFSPCIHGHTAKTGMARAKGQLFMPLNLNCTVRVIVIVYRDV
jgi:hypothetical protein